MSKRPRKSGRKKDLSAEDEAIWEQFSASVEPMLGKGRVKIDSTDLQAQIDSRETSVKQSGQAESDVSTARDSNGTPKPSHITLHKFSRFGMDRQEYYRVQ